MSIRKCRIRKCRLDSDGDATQFSFGFIIALYSFGQILSAPVFGYWSNKIKRVKLPLYVGLVLMFFGNVVYGMLEMLGMPIYMMMVGRFITGMGSANSALLRTYASTASTVKDRPKAIALVTCGQAIGNTAGPAFQLLFTPIGYPGFQIFQKIHINMYTAPAYFACAMNLFGALALLFLFKEHYAGIIDKDKSKDDKTQQINLPRYDIIAVFVCYITRFTQMFVNTNLETLGTPIAMMMYDWQQTTAVTNTSIAQGVLGSLTFLTYLIYIMTKAERYMHHFRVGCILALLVFLSFHIFTFPWQFWPHVVVQNVSANSPNHDKDIGCNTNLYDWCDNLTQVNVWVYYITYVIAIGCAFPSVNITMSTLFSRILGPRRQGTQQGVLQMSGSVARMIGPILISYLYTQYGPRIAWIMEGGVILFTALLWVVFYRRMIPLKIEKNANSTNKVENGTSTSEKDDAEVSNEASHTESQTMPRKINFQGVILCDESNACIFEWKILPDIDTAKVYSENGALTFVDDIFKEGNNSNTLPSTTLDQLKEKRTTWSQLYDFNCESYSLNAGCWNQCIIGTTILVLYAISLFLLMSVEFPDNICMYW